MSSITLYLKEKSRRREEKPIYEQVGETSIRLSGRQYDFCKIFNRGNNDYTDLIEVSEPCSYFIFMGPTGSGKTTTLRKVVDQKLESLEYCKNEASITAFEVTDNKYVIDLLTVPLKKREQAGSNLEAQLMKKSLSGDLKGIIDKVFARRNTQETVFNKLSSRSCLVISFYHNSQKVTYIDFMGNEKYDRSLSTSNTFANMNMTSITQLLARKSPVAGRSSNLITNLIFNNGSVSNGKISIVLNLDPYGDISLSKSILNNIASLVKDFKVNESPNKGACSSETRIPNYARPTISFLSPSKKVSTLSPIRKLSSTPAKFRMIPKTNRPSTAPKLRTRRSPQKFQTPTRVAVSINNATPIFKPNDLTSNFYEIQIKSLKNTIIDLEKEVIHFKDDNIDILHRMKHSNIEFENELKILRMDKAADSSVKHEPKDSLFDENEIQKQRKDLNDKVNDFKTEFYKFKNEHIQSSTNIKALKVSLGTLEMDNHETKTKYLALIKELQSVKDTLEKTETENIAINGEYDMTKSQNKCLQEQINVLAKENALKQELIDERQSSDTDHLKVNEKLRSVSEIVAGQKKELELNDSTIRSNETKILELSNIANTLQGNQQVLENLRNELTARKNEVKSLTTENEVLQDKHEKSIEELKTYKYKYKTLNNSWSQKFDKFLKVRDQSIVKLQSELNAQNIKLKDGSKAFKPKFNESEIYQDKPQSMSKKIPLQASNVKHLDNQTNKIQHPKKVKKSNKKKNPPKKNAKLQHV